MSASKIEFYVSCKGLKKADVLSKSDPFAVVKLGHTNKDGKVNYTEIGRTETIGNTSDPKFTKQFILDFFFNEIQYVKIYDSDQVSDDDSLGKADFTLGALMSAPGRSITEALKDRSGRLAKGVMIIRAEEVASCADRCKLSLRGIKLKNKDGIFGKSDPFFTVSRLREDEKWQQVHKSEVIMNDLSPAWQPQDMSVQALCNGDYLRPLQLEVWDWDRDGDHDCMGRLKTSLQGLLEGQGREMDLEHPKKDKKGKGQLKVDHAEVHRQPTLLEYLAGGLQISMTCAIDFTGSNGSPSHPQSLHYLDPSGRLNQYQQAIWSIGHILQDYDSDKMFPVYGFGGRINGQPVSHCFPICRVSHAGGSEEAYGVQGILEAYSAAMTSVQLAGPTLFTEVLETAMARANRPSTQADQRYDVLLILTDGIINDMQQTIDSLVAASNLPLSVVIVGVGQADFSDMSRLDGDGGMLEDSARTKATRDIVQFVPFSKYNLAEGGMGARLAADTMAEIPDQLLKFFRSKAITPNPPRPAAPLPQPPRSPTAPRAHGAAAGGASFDPPPPYTR
ncbi:unnamed protein product [Ectocarpus sp. CCAP 1310/34]|nr:unnamed protein product [Ectocarpus sp. CCAP 1310/34]